MQLALQHTSQNEYARCGIFIKHTAPKVWLIEIKRMRLQLSACTIYPCPSTEANQLSGILIIFDTLPSKIAIEKHSYILQAHQQLYIPENTKLNMALTPEEFDKILEGKPHFFHHEYGFIALGSPIRWEELVQVPNEAFPSITSPAKGVHIPTKVSAFSVEIEEKEAEKSLGNLLDDDTELPKELPFDMKKVLEGNNREVDKFLKYLESNPDVALKMAVPLDMMGTSRGKAFAKYKFKRNFFEKFGFGETSESVKSSFKTIIGIIAILAIFWLGYVVVTEINDKSDPQEIVMDPDVEELKGNELILDSTATNLVPVIRRRTSDNSNVSYADNEDTHGRALLRWLLYFLLIVLLFVIIFIIIGYTISNRKSTTTKKKVPKNTTASWMDLPEENELFSFIDTPKKGTDLYFGGNELSTAGKIIIFLLIVGLLVYLFYPMLQTPGIGTVFLVICSCIVLRLFYLLIHKDKTIIDDQG